MASVCFTSIDILVTTDLGWRRLRAMERGVARPRQTFLSPDHYTPTHTASIAEIEDPRAREILAAVDKNADDFGVHVFRWGDERQGIVHVVGPEQGITLPGLTLVCGDSHTSTHGALGCLSFGIGVSEVAHVLATQTLWQGKPRTMRIDIDGVGIWLGQGCHPHHP